MDTLTLLLISPVLSILAVILIRDKALVRLLIPILFWTNIALSLLALMPVLGNNGESLVINRDLSIEFLNGAFILLTAFVSACALTQTPLFFKVEEANSLSPYRFGEERLYYACAALFHISMTFVFLSDNLGFLWISIEATTLTSATLIYFVRTKHALEATWKYLIVCSVGIAFALLGSILIFASSQHGAVEGGSLTISELIAHADALDARLLRLGFICCLVGYGTKAGLFPLHNWLPDAHSEAPAPASAMLSGALLNCALFAIWRVSQIASASQSGPSSQFLLLTVGTITAVAASFFLVHQHGLKRMWAYSSIENSGIILIAIGLGSGPLFLLHAINHSLAKVALFLVSGNIIQLTGTKKLSEIRGLLSTSPSWAVLLSAAALAVTGSPPFGSFVSELLIIMRAIEMKQFLVAATLIVAITLAFIAVGMQLFRILFGTGKTVAPTTRSSGMDLVPKLLVALSLICGFTSLPNYLLETKNTPTAHNELNAPKDCSVSLSL